MHASPNKNKPMVPSGPVSEIVRGSHRSLSSQEWDRFLVLVIVLFQDGDLLFEKVYYLLLQLGVADMDLVPSHHVLELSEVVRERFLVLIVQVLSRVLCDEAIAPTFVDEDGQHVNLPCGDYEHGASNCHKLLRDHGARGVGAQ